MLHAGVVALAGRGTRSVQSSPPSCSQPSRFSSGPSRGNAMLDAKGPPTVTEKSPLPAVGHMRGKSEEDIDTLSRCPAKTTAATGAQRTCTAISFLS